MHQNQCKLQKFPGGQATRPPFGPSALINVNLKGR